MKTLQIVDTAYRATLEEQEDTVLWLTHVLRGAGAELTMPSNRWGSRSATGGSRTRPPWRRT